MKDYLPALFFVIGIALMGADAPDHATFSTAQAFVNLTGLGLFGLSMRMAHKIKTTNK